MSIPSSFAQLPAASQSPSPTSQVAWANTRSGIDWLFASAIAALAGGVLVMLGSLAVGMIPPEMQVQWYVAVGMLLAGVPLLIVATLTGLIGKAFCCTVAQETGAAPLAWGTIVCLFLAFWFAASAVQSMGYRMMYEHNAFNREPLYGMLQYVGFSLTGVHLFAAASGILEICFLRTLAIYLRNAALARLATLYLIYQVAVPVMVYVLVLGTFGLMMFTEGRGGPRQLDMSFFVTLSSQFTAGCLAVISLLWYFRLVQMSRENIRAYLPAQPR